MSIDPISSSVHPRPPSPSAVYRPTRTGLASTPSTLEANPRLEANGFFDCITEWFRSLFHCFFLGQEESSSTIGTLEGALTASVIDARVTMAKEFVEKQLRQKVPSQSQNDSPLWNPSGIEDLYIEDSKAIVLLKYHDHVDVAYCYLRGMPSLEALKRDAMNKIERTIRSPALAQAQDETLLSVDTIILRSPWVHNGTIHFLMYDQQKTLTLRPDNSFGSLSRGMEDFYYSFSINDISNILRDQIHSPGIQTVLDHFVREGTSHLV